MQQEDGEKGAILIHDRRVFYNSSKTVSVLKQHPLNATNIRNNCDFQNLSVLFYGEIKRSAVFENEHWRDDVPKYH